ncbi:CheR family methyltransferase [Geomonas subterranea]|uniref:Protein-glutamate O-methyltransferase CheR n=1 Tax=Geomonas subterranea TaxID=2847989 RepID=A0ABX8LND0_9BACT|nr:MULTISPECIES: protein-glutamate O-methyltransferase CheR [Geomonas]QXE91035.1 protein-glutamate O-methyltransferase CheR [Geomonas subterranea]QXM10879.1 protein-glutamate O-methyltransferase CheR [Geomonas subterranea]
MPLEKVVMQAEEFRLIKEHVAAFAGLVLEEGTQRGLATKLLPRLEELRLRNFTDYYCYLKFSPGRDAEWRRLVPLLTNNETYFFRESSQLSVLAQEVLPALKEAKLAAGERSIRILSAGCSSGEEVYTLAMLLLESGCFSWDWDVRITGLDIDERVLDAARQGVYTERSFWATEPHLVQRYLKRHGDKFVVRPMLRKWTGFTQGNLLDLASVAGERFDIIICRNVLIYFGDDNVKRVLDNFGALQPPGGYLFLGHSESLARTQASYLPLRFPGAIIYRKRG